jgi:hypothetical protein
VRQRVTVGLIFFAAFVTGVSAHDVITTKLTFSREISRIFAAHCLGCHAAGSEIPLGTYTEARPWAVAIKEQVLARKMPPWGAVKGFGDLAPDRALSEEDILIIAAWVVGGAPEGDPKLLPKNTLSAGVSPRNPFKDALVIDSEQKLRTAIAIYGVRPLPNSVVDSARLTADLPSGEIVPLVWLYQFDTNSQPFFTFRSPIYVPAGSVIRSSAPLRFALLNRSK